MSYSDYEEFGDIDTGIPDYDDDESDFDDDLVDDGEFLGEMR